MIRIVKRWNFLGPERDEKKVYRVFGYGEKDMKRFGSHPNHENRPLYEGPPSSGLIRGTADKEFFEFFLADPPHKEALFWGGSNHRT
jgi:hypothetical protein